MEFIQQAPPIDHRIHQISCRMTFFSHKTKFLEGAEGSTKNCLYIFRERERTLAQSNVDYFERNKINIDNIIKYLKVYLQIPSTLFCHKVYALIPQNA